MTQLRGKTEFHGRLDVMPKPKGILHGIDSVFPQPVQKPHPQVWEPVTSERSIRWAARNGVNAFTVPEANSRLKRNIDIYYDEAEKTSTQST